ncbi:hypothetical protein COL154_011279 [Colletotrichum chrysophilum]|nr:hypothetical protein COL154_011279 [Colletotrichum chrysophilum]
MESIDDVVDRARQALQGVSEDDENRWRNLAKFGGLLDWAWSQTKSMQYLEEAIGVSEAVVKVTAEKGLITNQADFLATLHSLWLEKYHETHEIMDLDKSIQAAKEAAELTPEDDEYKASRLSEHYSAIGMRAASDLSEAILMSRNAVKATHEKHPMRPDYLNGLSMNLGRQYYENGRREDLDEAIRSARETMKIAPSDHPDRGYFLINLSNRIGDRFTHNGDEDDLTESTQLAQEALEATTKHGPRLSIRMNNLGLRLRDRYLRTGETKDLDKSVDLARKATEATSTNTETPERTDQLFNLAIRLGDRYQRTGEEKDLKEAIELAKEAVQSTLEGHPAQGTRLNALASLLGDKYARSHVFSHLDDSIAFARKATLVGTQDHFVRHAEYLNNLGNRLSDRYSHAGALDDLEEAIKFHGEAVKTVPPTHPDRADYLNNLGNALSDRYERKREITDLDRAIIVSQEALATLVPQNNPNQGPILSTIGNRLIDRYSGETHPKRGQVEDLNMAISHINKAVQVTPEGRPDRVKYLNNQGKFYGLKFRHFEMQHLDDLELGISAANKAAVGLASDAAAIAIETGEGPTEALKLLETGRGIIADSLQKIRADISELHRSHPKLAQAFDQLRNLMDSSNASHGDSGKSSIEADTRHLATARMENLLSKIQQQPGFEGFLGTMSEDQMLRAGAMLSLSKKITYELYH